jgi:hypothetical protein
MKTHGKPTASPGACDAATNWLAIRHQ